MAWKRKRRAREAPEPRQPPRGGFDWPDRPAPTAVTVIKRPVPPARPPARSTPAASTSRESDRTPRPTDLWDELDRMTEVLVGELRAEFSPR